LRFVCDHHVDARVAAVLRRCGHDAWTAGNAGLAKAADDALTVYSDNRGAVLITHDVDFSMRRRHNVIGRHIFLRCNEWDAPDVILRHLEDILPVLERYSDVWVKLSLGAEPAYSFDWR
jgi:predicted nuclease of predicted toxin-antitoxin system